MFVIRIVRVVLRLSSCTSMFILASLFSQVASENGSPWNKNIPG